MLGMKEKLELTSQLMKVSRQLESGELGMMERLRLSGERNSILSRLKAKPKSAEPPKEPEKVEVRKPKTLRYSSNIGSKIKAGDTILNSKMGNWAKKYKAENALNSAGLQGLAIAEGNDEFGWKIKVIEQLPQGTTLEVSEQQTRVSGLDTWSYSVKVKAGNNEVQSKLLSLAKAYDDDAKMVNSSVVMGKHQIEQMAKEKGFKLDISSLSKDGRDSFEPELDESIKSGESELIVKFKSGYFNNTKPADFVEVMRDVHTDGLTLDEVKKGAISWFKANPDLIVDRAA